MGDQRALKTENLTGEEKLHASSVADIKETSDVWKAVRGRVLSQCRFWDLLLDKASFSYFYDGKAKKLPKDNLRKFRAVVKEIEDLLGEFKCFMDACLMP